MGVPAETFYETHAPAATSDGTDIPAETFY